MPAKPDTPKKLLFSWKAAHWPPKGMRKIDALPIYVGDHKAVTAFAESLCGVMALVSEHVVGTGNGKIPRWMAVPKIEYLVERLNIVTSTAKASLRFGSLIELEAGCGPIDDEGKERLLEWFSNHEGGEVVAHKAFIDLRAYVFCKDQPDPRRHRFYQSGLVVAAPPGGEILIQDNRHVVRAKRRDSRVDPLAVTTEGWDVYAGKPRAQ